MKKYIAMILSLMMIGCAFTACGDSNDSGDEKKTTASSKEKATDDDEAASDEEDDTTEDDEEDTTEDEEKPTKNKGKNKLSKAYGNWRLEGLDKVYINIEDATTAYLVVEQDLSENICFDENKNLRFMGKIFGVNGYKFKNGKFVLEYDDVNMLTMKKTDGSDDVFGEYEWVSGTSYDSFVKGFSERAESGAPDEDDIQIKMTCEENKTLLNCYIAVDGFRLDEETITMNSSLLGDGFSDIPYELDGDEIILTNEDGKTKKMIRMD